MKKDTLNVRRILTYAAILSLLAYFILTWTNMLGDFYMRTGSDFIGFYGFGRIPQLTGKISDIYRIEAQQALQEKLIGHPVTPIFYTHLPFIAPLAILIVNEDYVGSFKRWAVILLLLNALNIYLLVGQLDWKKFSMENLAILCAAMFLFDPTFSGFMNGQDTAILLLGAAIWTREYYKGNYFLAGLGLGLTTVRPQVALFLAIPFLFKHRRLFWGFIVSASSLAILSIVLLGVDGTFQFIDSIRYIEGTIWHERHAVDMPTLSGMIRRNVVTSNFDLVKNAVWLCYLLGIVGFSTLWKKSAVIDERHIGMSALFAIFLLPYAHYHDLILLLIPIISLLRICQKTGTIRQENLVLIPLIISWMSALGFAGTGSIKFPIVYTVMLVLGYLIIKTGRLISAASLQPV